MAEARKRPTEFYYLRKRIPCPFPKLSHLNAPLKRSKRIDAPIFTCEDGCRVLLGAAEVQDSILGRNDEELHEQRKTNDFLQEISLTLKVILPEFKDHKMKCSEFQIS